MENKFWYVALFSLYLISVADGYQRAVPAIFIFGDSAIDVGTNNYLPFSYAKSNFPYNGIDYPHGKATGRFSNGFNIGDQLDISLSSWDLTLYQSPLKLEVEISNTKGLYDIAVRAGVSKTMMFGFYKSPPPYLYLVNKPSIDFKKKVQRGVNFASAGSGLFDHTGSKAWTQVVPMSQQIQQFTTVISNITLARGSHNTSKVLAKALYIFCVGSNEFFDYMRAKNDTPPPLYVSSVISSYHDHLKNVYNMGGRKFAVMGVAPIGCCPYARAINAQEGGGDNCKQSLNDFAQSFYNATKILLQNLSSELPNFKYSLGNVHDMTMDMLNDYPSYGFKEIKYACCGSGNYNGVGGCYDEFKPNLCSNRTDHLFWDLYHPSEAASQLLANQLFSGNSTYMTPMNFSQLALSQVRI